MEQICDPSNDLGQITSQRGGEGAATERRLVSLARENESKPPSRVCQGSMPAPFPTLATHLIPLIAEKGSIFISLVLIKMKVPYVNEGRDTWKAHRVGAIHCVLITVIFS